MEKAVILLVSVLEYLLRKTQEEDGERFRSLQDLV